MPHPHLLQPGLGAAVEGAGFEVLGDEVTGTEYVQGQALAGHPEVPVYGGAALWKAEPSHPQDRIWLPPP